MLDKQGAFDLLKKHNIPYTLHEHAPIFTVAEGDALGDAFHAKSTKNLFLRDKKKREYYLVTLPCHKAIDLEVLKNNIPSRRLSFGSEEELETMLGIKSGSVNPLCILNDVDKKVVMVFDRSMIGQEIGIHPMSNDATILLKFEDLLKLLQEQGHTVVLCDI